MYRKKFDNMMYWRQEDIVDNKVLSKMDIHLIGAGGIGNPTALALSKMGCSKITCYDHDTIMPHNLSSTFYPKKSVRKLKVKALASLVKQLTGEKINYDAVALMSEADINIKSTGDLMTVVIVAVDNMETRKLMWEYCKKAKSNVALMIEARMGALQGRVYTIEPSDVEAHEMYEKTLYSDDETIEEPCTRRAIIGNTLFIASLISNQFRLWAMQEDYNREILFDLQNMNLIARNKKVGTVKIEQNKPDIPIQKTP